MILPGSQGGGAFGPAVLLDKGPSLRTVFPDPVKSPPGRVSTGLNAPCWGFGRQGNRNRKRVYLCYMQKASFREGPELFRGGGKVRAEHGPSGNNRAEVGQSGRAKGGQETERFKIQEKGRRNLEETRSPP